MLELRCPPSVEGIAVNPQPDWSFDSLISELNSLEKKLNASSTFPLPFNKTRSRGFSDAKGNESSSRAFVMRVLDEDMPDAESDVGEEDHDRSLAALAGRRFTCGDLCMSDSEDSEDELTHGGQCHLMKKAGLVEGALSEITHEHQLSVTEEIRNEILALESKLMSENEKFASAQAHIEKYIEARQEMERKFDLQYQRIIAEELDNHLTAVQRDREHRSQIEEKRIRDDAAHEEAKRKQKAVEKAQQEAEEARRQAEKKLAEEAKRAALAADRRAEEVAKEKERAAAAALVARQEATVESKGVQPHTSKEVNPPEKNVAHNIYNAALRLLLSSVNWHFDVGNILKGAESALKLEERRLQTYMEMVRKNEELGVGSSKDYRNHGMQIARRIKTITGTKESVRTKAGELIQIMKSPCPQSISIAMFAEKVVSQCSNPTGSFNNAVYAYCHVIVLVTSQVPTAMEIVLAELNRVCIYTVPKYYSQSGFETKDAYYKAIGYQEEDGKIESPDSYVARLSSYMKLYGALVQTEVEGVQNYHGIKEGWAWLARFLNILPANLYTANALQAFLEMAGFALYRRYKSQFRKLLNIIYRDFLNALRAASRERGDSRLNKVITSIQSYIESNQFLNEPKGRRLQSSLLSHQFVPESDYQEQYYSPSHRYY
ncbi:hypothetical protein RJ640_030712 [Escallonia rubra]|uniref:mRNA export factor GLE1 n=1 Tax=Escallonia rubra TaxID=112253 RepID=A0AA88QG60_9ASTE|nr:hypothetical protein RJ640_030712 [Escallonia rubra]